MPLTSNQRFGRLRLLERTVMTKRAKWLALCDCGNVTEVWASSLQAGSTKSCGCLRAEVVGAKNTTHGESKTALYRVWAAMLERCNKPESPSYRNYGARGIKVCKRWNSYAAFKKDVGDRPSPLHSLDRVDNDKDYRPSNVRWATRKEQARNTRRNIKIEYAGRVQTAADWAEETGISRATLLDRLQIQKLTAAEALTRPLKGRKSYR